jgi:hypothetical protein
VDSVNFENRNFSFVVPKTTFRVCLQLLKRFDFFQRRRPFNSLYIVEVFRKAYPNFATVAAIRNDARHFPTKHPTHAKNNRFL